MRRPLLAASLLAAACGGSPPTTPDSTPTGAITVHARGAKLVALRDGEGPWRELSIGADGDAHGDAAASDYDIAVVCDEPYFFDVTLVRSNMSDPREHTAACTAATPNVPVSQARGIEVTVGGYRLFEDGAVEIPTGTYDVVAVDKGSTPPRAVIQRGVTIGAATTLGFDFATGLELRPVTVTVAHGAGENSSVATRLKTGGGADVVLESDTFQAWVFPASALAADDRQYIRAQVATTAPDAGRGARQALGASETAVTVTMPPSILRAAATWSNGPVLTWEAPGTWGQVFARASDRDGFRNWNIVLRPGWCATHGPVSATSLPDLSRLANWQARWNQPTADGIEWEVDLINDGLDGGASWSYSKGAYPTTALAPRAANTGAPRAAIRAPLDR
ncbi:MAG: hypothetical protein K8W52_06835 [Deltaproteobacteria bacterium]|nr:hypothetical protein [Deltaproteobacteria bacterium]